VEIIRGPRSSDNFTTLSNSLLRDSRLSWRARGILAGILSNVNGWSTNAERIAREGKEGRDAVLTAMNELESVGYIHRRKSRNGLGQYVTQMMVFEHPEPAQSETPSQIHNGKPGPGYPTPDNQAPLEDHQEDDQEGEGESAGPDADDDDMDAEIATHKMVDLIGWKPSRADFNTLKVRIAEIPYDLRPQLVEVAHSPPPRRVRHQLRFLLDRIDQVVPRQAAS
jgi:hypothetical protein